jgi:hypothetical protein
MSGKGEQIMAIELHELLENCRQYAERHGLQFDYGDVAAHDADAADQMIAIGYWWDGKLGKLQAMLQRKYEDAQLTTHFEDETAMCGHCYKYVLTQPTHYGWLPNYMWLGDCELICRECALENPEWWLDDSDSEYINGTTHAFMPWFVPALEKNGWTCFQPDTDGCAHYETGWYDGQVDDPVKVAAYLGKELPNHDHAFVITSVGQFDTHWTVYVRRRDEE